MTSRRALAVVSTVQLGVGLVGAAVAVRRRRAYDILGFRGSPDAVGRDAMTWGTALSAPAPMLAAQAILTAALAAGRGRRPAQGLALLGAAMVPGYLGERLGRARLRPSGFDRIETPLILVGTGLAAAMAVLGRAQLVLRPGPQAQVGQAPFFGIQRSSFSGVSA